MTPHIIQESHFQPPRGALIDFESRKGRCLHVNELKKGLIESQDE